MGSKRDFSALAAVDYDEANIEQPTQTEPSNKRRREQQQPRSKSKQTEGKVDPTYGQKAAFPGIDDGDIQLSDEDLEFEECGDALAYLQSVRQEARHVPHIIVAPKAGPQLPPELANASADDDQVDHSLYENGVGDSRGYYYDGAYTAAPSSPTSAPPSPAPDMSPSSSDAVTAQNRALREAYYASLAKSFLSLRALLHQEPSPELIAALPKDHGTEVGSFGPRSWTFRVWTNRMRHTDPLPVQIAALERQSVLKLLRVMLGGKFIRRGYELRERTSRWIWALLARLPDRGELGYDEVGWVRELGKRAVLMMVSMEHMDALREEVEDVDGEEFEDDDGDLVAKEDTIEVAMPPVEEEASAEIESVPQEEEEGEVDMDIDDGEVFDDDDYGPSGVKGDEAEDIEAVKARLLASLEETQVYDEQEGESRSKEKEENDQEESASQKAAKDADSAGINMRATLNMILTVAGEFYGQRDLLEFRNPFPCT
ncbi:hypothetical protein QBC38DRAFT_511681 [Podospora fimiseda]|uniref:Uncharacterized protein n=1 Tax=Podospora fimiseda TaxID=252190 RepID=A0AAN7GTL1_9PEZI|nr:hypothetical protein QBC38DRAFT_511681 [Podospora fimiseda]